MTSGSSTRGRRWVAALLLFATTIVVAAFVYLVAVLSDWSGQHLVPIETTVGAAVILVVGSLLSLWVLRSRA